MLCFVLLLTSRVLRCLYVMSINLYTYSAEGKMDGWIEIGCTHNDE